MGDRGLGGAGAPEAPETGCEALQPDPSSRPDGARGGPRGIADTTYLEFEEFQ